MRSFGEGEVAGLIEGDSFHRGSRTLYQMGVWRKIAPLCIAKSRRNRTLVELIENGIEADKPENKNSFDLAERAPCGQSS